MQYRWIGLGLALASLTMAARPVKSGIAPAFYAYFRVDGITNQVVGVSVAGDGGISQIAGSPFTAAGNTALGGDARVTGSLAISRARRTVFIGGGSGVGAAKIAADGTLTPVAGSPFGSAPAQGVAVAEIGSKTFVYASDTASSLVHIFRASNSGALSRATNPVFMPGARGITVAGRRVFFALSDGKFVVCKLKENGALAALPGYPKATGLPSLDQITPATNGKFVYASAADGRVQGYRLNDSGKSILLTGSPFLVRDGYAGGVLPLARISPRFLGVSLTGNGVGPNFAVLRRGTDGKLSKTAFSGSTADGIPVVAASPDGQFYVVATSTGALGTIHVNATNGAVTPGLQLNAGLDDLTGAAAYRP